MVCNALVVIFTFVDKIAVLVVLLLRIESVEVSPVFDVVVAAAVDVNDNLVVVTCVMILGWLVDVSTKKLIKTNW